MTWFGPIEALIRFAANLALKGSAGLGNKEFYQFDGVDDKCIILAADAPADTFIGGGVVRGTSMFNDTTSGDRIVDKGAWLFRKTTVVTAGKISLEFLHFHNSLGDSSRWKVEDIVGINEIFTWAIDYDNSNLTNNPIIYINGQSVAVTKTASGTASADSDSIYDLILMANNAGTNNFCEGQVHGFALENLSLSAIEIANLSAGEPIPAKYSGAKIIHDSDFSADADGWTAGGNALVVGDIDSIGNEDDWLRITCNGAGVNIALQAFAGEFIPGQKYKVKVRVFIPAQTYVNQLLFATAAGAAPTILDSGPTDSVLEPVADTVTDYILEYTADTDWGDGVRFYMGDDGSASLDVGAVGEVAYVKLIVIEDLGNTLNLDSFGVAQAFDSDHPDIIATVTGATLENAPIGHIAMLHYDGLTNDTGALPICPAGWEIIFLDALETAGNAAQLDFGSSAGTSDIYPGVNVVASDNTTAPVATYYPDGTDVFMTFLVGAASAVINLTACVRKVR